MGLSGLRAAFDLKQNKTKQALASNSDVKLSFYYVTFIVEIYPPPPAALLAPSKLPAIGLVSRYKSRLDAPNHHSEVILPILPVLLLVVVRTEFNFELLDYFCRRETKFIVGQVLTHTYVRSTTQLSTLETKLAALNRGWSAHYENGTKALMSLIPSSRFSVQRSGQNLSPCGKYLSSAKLGC
jgi:hypothetical protein